MRLGFGLFSLLLTCGAAHAQATFHAVQSGPNPNGGNLTLNLPTVSNNDFVLCGAVAAGRTTTGPPFTTPAGWTSYANAIGYAIIGEVWTTGDATSVILSPQNGAGSWETGACISYSGANTTTPVDGVTNLFMCQWDNSATISVNYCRAPAISPAMTNDVWLAFYFDSNSGGSTVTTPTGFTNREHNAPGPTIDIDEQTLTSGNQTADAEATFGSNTFHNGISILINAASGGSAVTPTVTPTLGGIRMGGTGSSPDFSVLNPVNGDLVAIFTYGGGSITTGGYTTVFHTSDVGLYTIPWHTGDGTTATETGTNASWEATLVRNYNPTGATLVSPAVDTSGTTTAASATSINAPSLTLAGTKELLMVTYSSGDNSASNTNAWTLPGGLTYDTVFKGPVNISTIAEGSLLGPTSPTTAYTGNIAGSAARLGSGAVAFKIAGGTTANPWVIVVN